MAYQTDANSEYWLIESQETHCGC